MSVNVQYKGARADSLSTYNLPKFKGGPYDFTKKVCAMDELDARYLLKRDPRAFERYTGPPVKPAAKAPVKPVAEAPVK